MNPLPGSSGKLLKLPKITKPISSVLYIDHQRTKIHFCIGLIGHPFGMLCAHLYFLIKK